MNKMRLLAYFSLVYGGFLVIAYAAFAYSAVWRQEFLPSFGARQILINASGNFTEPPFPSGRPPRETSFVSIMDAAHGNSVSQLLSLPMLAVLLTGVAFLVNGYVLLKHLREKEHREIKKFVVNSLLTDDEKIMYEQLLKLGGEATQKQLSLNTGYSAVKTYRILQRLEQKKVVKSFPFGMTKKIILNQDLPEK